MPKTVQQDFTITEEDLEFVVLQGEVFSRRQMNSAKEDAEGYSIPPCTDSGREGLRQIAQRKYDREKRGLPAPKRGLWDGIQVVVLTCPGKDPSELLETERGAKKLKRALIDGIDEGDAE